jgi:hypothetical protein
MLSIVTLNNLGASAILFLLITIDSFLVSFYDTAQTTRRP